MLCNKLYKKKKKKPFKLICKKFLSKIYFITFKDSTYDKKMVGKENENNNNKKEEDKEESPDHATCTDTGLQL